jgi:hypothetical protein
MRRGFPPPAAPQEHPPESGECVLETCIGFQFSNRLGPDRVVICGLGLFVDSYFNLVLFFFRI